MTLGTIPIDAGTIMQEPTFVTFPWPPASLSPNSRKDRRANTKERAAFKKAWWATALHKLPRGTHLTMEFFPPDNRPRDLDNMFASVKYGIDGIALAIGIDDKDFSFTIRKRPKSLGGKVLVGVTS